MRRAVGNQKVLLRLKIRKKRHLKALEGASVGWIRDNDDSVMENLQDT